MITAAKDMSPRNLKGIRCNKKKRKSNESDERKSFFRKHNYVKTATLHYITYIATCVLLHTSATESVCSCFCLRVCVIGLLSENRV